MDYDIEETKDRIEKLKLSEIRRKHRAAAKEKGFNRVDDYDVWLVLEDLRARTLRAAREQCTDGKATHNVVVNAGSIVSGGPVFPFRQGDYFLGQRFMLGAIN